MFSRLGQAGRAPSPLKELDAEASLQISDLLRKRRLRNSFLLSGAGEGARSSHSHEAAKLVKIHDLLGLLM